MPRLRKPWQSSWCRHTARSGSELLTDLRESLQQLHVRLGEHRTPNAKIGCSPSEERLRADLAVDLHACATSQPCSHFTQRSAAAAARALCRQDRQMALASVPARNPLWDFEPLEHLPSRFTVSIRSHGQAVCHGRRFARDEGGFQWPASMRSALSCSCCFGLPHPKRMLLALTPLAMGLVLALASWACSVCAEPRQHDRPAARPRRRVDNGVHLPP